MSDYREWFTPAKMFSTAWHEVMLRICTATTQVWVGRLLGRSGTQIGRQCMAPHFEEHKRGDLERAAILCTALCNDAETEHLGLWAAWGVLIRAVQACQRRGSGANVEAVLREFGGMAGMTVVPPPEAIGYGTLSRLLNESRDLEVAISDGLADDGRLDRKERTRCWKEACDLRGVVQGIIEKLESEGLAVGSPALVGVDRADPEGSVSVSERKAGGK